MKKIVNIMILIMISLLPVMVEAKANFELDAEILGLAYQYKDEDKFFYLDSSVSDVTVGRVKALDDNYNLLEETFLMNEEAKDVVDFYGHEPFFEYMKLTSIINKDGLLLREENILYYFTFIDGSVSSLDLDTSENEEFYFEDNPSLVKNILGGSYDLYNKLVDEDYSIELIRENDGYYLVDYLNENQYLYYTAIFDDKFNKIITFELDYNSNQAIYIYDSLIYVMRTNKILDIYKLDGTKYQTFTIESDNIPTLDSTHCNYRSPLYLNIINDKLYIVYGSSRFKCEERLNYSDANDLAKSILNNIFSDALTLVYNLNFDVEKVNSSNGDFTYETKKDEDGKSYVELKVTPKDGYSVKEIIVTDVNGERIEVTNNKFYKPLNDVKIEVKYVLGEYLPIPDTLLNVNMWAISFGIIFIVFGITSMVKIMSEDKIKE